MEYSYSVLSAQDDHHSYLLIACVTQIEHTCRKRKLSHIQHIQIVQGNSLSVNMIHAKNVSCSKGKVKHRGNRLSFQWKQDCSGSRSKNDKYIHSLKLTWPLKIDGWKTSFLFGWPIFRCYVSFRKGMNACYLHVPQSRIWGPVVACIFGRDNAPICLCQDTLNLILLHYQCLNVTRISGAFFNVTQNLDDQSGQGWKTGLQSFLVGGVNPFEKYARQNGVHLPQMEVNIRKYWKPPPSYQRLNFVLKDHLVGGFNPSQIRSAPQVGVKIENI